MALYKRTELCTLLGISQAVISMAISRDHLVLSGKLIDDSIPVNDLFIKKKLAGKGESKSNIEKIKDKSEDTNDTLNDSKGRTSLSALNELKIKAYVSKTKQEIEVIKLKREKLEGSMLPVNLIESILLYLTESCKVVWSNASEDLITKVGAAAHLTRAKQAELKTEQFKLLNESVDKIADMTIKRLKDHQMEVSSQKGVGERE